MNYLLSLTFYAGSDDQEDTDKELYLVKSKRPISKSELERVIKTANNYCSPYNDDNEKIKDFPSYDSGLNIDTLVEGVNKLIEEYAECVKLNKEENKINENVESLYVIEQWQ